MNLFVVPNNNFSFKNQAAIVFYAWLKFKIQQADISLTPSGKGTRSQVILFMADFYSKTMA